MVQEAIHLHSKVKSFLFYSRQVFAPPRLDRSKLRFFLRGIGLGTRPRVLALARTPWPARRARKVEKNESVSRGTLFHLVESSDKSSAPGLFPRANDLCYSKNGYENLVFSRTPFSCRKTRNNHRHECAAQEKRTHSKDHMHAHTHTYIELSAVHMYTTHDGHPTWATPARSCRDGIGAWLRLCLRAA